MTRVSITNFRNNLAEYLRLVKYKGETVTVVDEKLGELMVEVSPPTTDEKAKENWQEYLKFVERMYGVFKDIPEDANRKALRKADKTSIKKRLKK